MESSVQNLLKISNNKQFSKGSYLCHEGQPGNEMYVILKGSVAVCVMGSTGQSEEIVRLGAGEFICEMSVFDQLPRSASCIVLEDTLCTVIDKKNLRDFIAMCPDLAEKLMISLSRRIRDMNARIFTPLPDDFLNTHNISFSLPKEYIPTHSYVPNSPNLQFLESNTITCPICGKMTVVQIPKLQLMSCERIQVNQRQTYKELDPIWYQIWKCGNCDYVNDRSSFVNMANRPHSFVRQIMVTQNEYLNKLELNTATLSAFDSIVIQYFKTIHLHEVLNPDNILFIGSLWLYLYWLFSDSGDIAMIKFCREKLINYYIQSITKFEAQLRLKRQYAKYSLILGCLYEENNDLENSFHFYQQAIDFGDASLKQFAYIALNKLQTKRGKSGKQ